MSTSATTALRTIAVQTASRSYDVLVGADILGGLGSRVRTATGASRPFVVTDTTVGPLYLTRIEEALHAEGYDAPSFAMPAGEVNKHLGTLGDVCQAIAQAELSRDDTVVALGGGVVGDLAGFAAAIYMRGIQVVQVPTTLLAMVDSSVGGKTAIDATAGKNLLGAFLQPSLVMADVQTLSTLSPEVFVDGIGEVVKHAVLADEALFEELTAHPLTQAADEDYLARVVARNVEIKRDVVNTDERERGLRQTLNLGHTIGHAIEASSGYRLGHGHCVAAGLCCMARATEALGWSEPGLARRIERCVAAQGLPTTTDIAHEDLVYQAAFDKKRHGDSVNVIVPTAIGSAEVRRVSLEEFSRIVELGCSGRSC